MEKQIYNSHSNDIFVQYIIVSLSAGVYRKHKLHKYGLYDHCQMDIGGNADVKTSVGVFSV